jgi:hypothetical protein
MKRAYTILLRLYPRDYRAMFGREMRLSFEMAANERRAAERRAAERRAAELMGLLTGAVREWIAKLTTDKAVRGRVLPDLMMMRPPGVPTEIHFAGPLLDD